MALLALLKGLFAFLKGLFCGGDDAASMAKTSFNLLFCLALDFWWRGLEIQPAHKEMMMYLLAYIFGGKMAWGVSQLGKSRSGSDNASGQP